MSVVALGRAVIDDERKRQFLDIVARTYDQLVDEGDQPDTIVFSLASMRGGGRTNWLCLGEAEGASGPALARAILDLQTRYVRHQIKD